MRSADACLSYYFAFKLIHRVVWYDLTCSVGTKVYIY